MRIEDRPAHIRRLALSALLNLLLLPNSTATHETLLPTLQTTVLSLLSPPPTLPSSPSTSSSRSTSSTRLKRSNSTLEPIQDPNFLLALLQSITPPSPLHPLPTELASQDKLIRIHLSILTLLSDPQWPPGKLGQGMLVQGIRCGWLIQAVLNGLTRLMGEIVEGGEMEFEMRRRIEEGVQEWIEKSRVVDLARKDQPGLSGGSFDLLTCLGPPLTLFFYFPKTALLLSTLPLLSTSSLQPILTIFANHLQHAHSPNRMLLGLKGLRAVDPKLWTMREQGEGDDERIWGENCWRNVMSGLDHPDENVRKEVSWLRRFLTSSLLFYDRGFRLAKIELNLKPSLVAFQTILLLLGVEPNLIELHFNRLIESLQSISNNTSSQLDSSTARLSRPHHQHQHRQQTIRKDLLISLLLEIISILISHQPSTTSPKIDGTIWAQKLSSIIIATTTTTTSSSSSTIEPKIITNTIDLFSYPTSVISKAMRRSFVEALWVEGSWRGKEEEGRGGVMKGLVLAGLAEVGLEGGEEGVERVVGIVNWLKGGGGTLFSVFSILTQGLVKDWSLIPSSLCY